MYYGYCSQEHEPEQNIEQQFHEYAAKNSFSYQQFVFDPLSNKVHWEKRELNQLISQADENSHIVVFEASDLARSTLQVLEILDVLKTKKINLHIIRYSQMFTPDKVYDTAKFLQLMKHIEGEFVTKRTTDALARRRAAGLPLGRPKGRKNKVRKLDKHRTEIKKYLALNINKASIAKLVGCHAQTLYNYLEDTNLMEEVENERVELIKAANEQRDHQVEMAEKVQETLRG